MSDDAAGGAAFSVEELQALVAELREINTGLGQVLAGKDRQIAALEARIAELERGVGQNSSTSSRPPSSDSPYTKPAPRSSRTRSGRKPGKQPGSAGFTLPLVEDPDEVIDCEPGPCPDCGADLGEGQVLVFQRRQVFDIPPPPPRPHVREYRLWMRACPCCGTTAAGPPPGWVRARTQYGPRVCAQAAHLLAGHYLPVGRAGAVLAAMTGAVVSTGFLAGIRARAARLLEVAFLPRVRELLAGAGVIHVDETPGRAAGTLRYVHVAATEHLTVMHTGGRTKADIDAGGVLAGYTGTIVRDGYAGYAHLTDAHHAWCGAHLARDLRALHEADPDGQVWASAMATTLADANTAAAHARAAGADALDAATLARIRNHYRGATAKGITDNSTRAGPHTRNGATLARRFRDNEDMILRFVTDLAVPWTNNQAERDVRPVKIQQRTSGGCWRTLEGIADFAIVTSYLSTATKWGLDKIDVLHQLFTTGAWLPPALTPAE